MHTHVRAPSKREALLAGSLVCFLIAGLAAGDWFNSQVSIKGATIYGIVLPSRFSTTSQSIYIIAATPTTSFNGDMNSSGTNPGLRVLPSGNNSYIVQLKSNLTSGTPEAFYITNIPLKQGVSIRNYTFNQPFPLTYSTGPGSYAQMPYDLEVRLLASSPAGTISWQSYILYVGYHNYGLQDTRALTSEFDLLLFVAASAMLWGVLVKFVAKRQLPVWFPVGSLLILCVVLFVFVFVGSTFEIDTPGWSSSWAWLARPFSHQGFSHISGNLPPFAIATLSLELLLRKFGRQHLYLLAFGAPVMVDYLLNQLLSGAGVSVLLGTFSVTVWIVLVLYWQELQERMRLRWILGAVIGSGLALAGVTVTYLGDLIISLPLQNTFWVGEAIWHPAAITIEGLSMLLILGTYQNGLLGRMGRCAATFLRRPAVGWILPLALLLAEFYWFSFYPLLPYSGPTPSTPHFVVTYANASQWDITLRNPLGQLTSFLVFDGWNNIWNLMFGVVTVVIFYRSLARNSGWRVSGGLFLVTNLAGLLAPTAIYAWPTSPFASWGLSSATFAPIGYAAAESLFVFVVETRQMSKGSEFSRLILYLSFGWFLFSAGLMTFAANSNPIVESVHATSIGIGLLGGMLVFWSLCRRVVTRV